MEGENPSDAEDQVETQIIGGADAPTEVRLQDDTDQKENTDALPIFKINSIRKPKAEKAVFHHKCFFHGG